MSSIESDSVWGQSTWQKACGRAGGEGGGQSKIGDSGTGGGGRGSGGGDEDSDADVPQYAESQLVGCGSLYMYVAVLPPSKEQLHTLTGDLYVQ